MAQIAAAAANSSSSAAAEAALWANYTAIYHAALTEVLWNQVAKRHFFEFPLCLSRACLGKMVNYV